MVKTVQLLLYYMCVCDRAFASLPHCNSGDSFAYATRCSGLCSSTDCDLGQSRSRLFRRCFPTSYVKDSWECCSWLPSPASNVSGCKILVYGQLCRGFIWRAKHMSKQTPLTFDRRQAQWVECTFLVEGSRFAESI